jgi:hypothetical protein
MQRLGGILAVLCVAIGVFAAGWLLLINVRDQIGVGYSILIALFAGVVGLFLLFGAVKPKV